MHAIICDIQFAHGVNLPIFLVILPFSFSFFLFFLSFFMHIFLNVTARLTLLICVFLGVKYQETHKVPTYLTLTFFSFLSLSFWGIIAGYLGSYVVSK